MAADEERKEPKQVEQQSSSRDLRHIRADSSSTWSSDGVLARDNSTIEVFCLTAGKATASMMRIVDA
jgi:hypothetical protein